VLGGSTIKRVISIILIAIILTGCSKNKNDYYYNSFAVQSQTKENESENVEITKQLTMNVFYTAVQETYEKYARQYMDLHPEVEVNISCISTDFNWTMGEITSKYLTKLNTELMSGKSADIVDVTVFASDKVAKSGLFTDLYEYIKKDETFNMDDYYGNIFSALEYEKKLYILPFQFYYGLTSVNSSKINIDTLKNKNGINIRDLVSLYNEWLSTTTDESINLKRAFAPHQYIEGILDDFIDYENRTASINGDKFIKLLEESKQLPTDTEYIQVGPTGAVSRSSIGGSALSEKGYSNKYLYKNFSISYADIPNMISETNPDYNNLFPTINDTGEYEFSAQHVFAITEASKEKELAWDFLHYCISEEAFDTMGGNDANTHWLDVFNWFEGGYIPINRNLFNVVYPQFIDMQMEIGIPNREEAIDELVEKIDTWNTKQSRFKSRNYELFMTLVYPELYLFYTNQANAAETANKIQRKIELYLNE
jgi:multiple sugar transport system substrate-binding protein